MENDSPVSVVRTNSVRLIRASSVTFAGGAAHIPHQSEEQADTENTPVRGQSRRDAIRSQREVQQRIVQEVEQFFTNRLGPIICFGCTLMVALIAVAVLFILAAIANVVHFSEPCDEPLKWYLLVSLLWSQVPQHLTQCFARCFHIEDPFTIWILQFSLGLPAWFITGWGVYMLTHSSTCQKTNPGLFYPMKHYIVAQIIIMALLTVVSIFCALGIRYLLMLANMLSESPGCEKAVHNLPKVDAEASELIDTDGEVKSCIICLGELAKKQADWFEGKLTRTSSFLGATASAIVKTPCKHYFHEDCLATWCKNHLDCPLCREQIGDPDPKEDGARFDRLGWC